MTSTVLAIDAWLLALPLERPYRLSFGAVDAFDTVLVRVTLEDGRAGWGEATLLTGYTEETIAGAWAKARALLGAGRTLASAGPAGEREVRDEARQLDAWLAPLDTTDPFLTTAFRTAMEMAASSPLLRPAAPAGGVLRLPILGLLQSASADALPAAVEDLLAQGHDTLKVKVGFDAGADAARVAAVQSAVAGRARLRLDANQGYSAGQALAFVERLDPHGIELFEQPCAAGDWDSHMQVAHAARDRGLPLMLDESIYSLAEIERAAALGAARFIKVKLMKFGGLARLKAALERIRALGMEPVLGNGVANELGCWMEACVGLGRIAGAGEMNGFLKPRERLFSQPLAFRAGALEWPADQLPGIDADRVARLALDHARWPSPGA